MFFARFLKITGIICGLYGAAVLLTTGFRNIFNWFFPLLGILLTVMSYRCGWFRGHPVLKRVLDVLAVLFLILFVFIELQIIAAGMKGPEKEADHLIVLGSGVSDKGLSVDFKARLDAAYDYLAENPGTVVIVTGGKGDNEPMAEAVAGREYLLSLGISKERIITEDKSHSTYENLSNAYALIEETGREPGRTVIVSSSFHLYRAMFIAKQVGFTNISGKGSHGMRSLDPQYYTREFFAYLKYRLFLLYDR